MKAKQPIHKTISAIAATSLALALCVNSHAQAADKSDAESAVGSIVTGAKRSQHFDAVSQHLNLGGTVYGYVDIDGDIEKLAGMFQGMFDLGKEQAGNDMPPHLRNLDMMKELGKLGLDGIEAVGMSSIKTGDLHHNKFYAHVPAGRKGLLKIFGGDPKPYVATQLAPADTDLIIEQSINVKAGFEVVSEMVSRFGGLEATQQFDAGVREKMPEIGMSWFDILSKLDTRVTVIGRLHLDKPLEIPDAPMEIPSFDLLIALDDTGWLFDKIIAEGKKQLPPEQQAQMFAKGDGFEKVMAPPMPSPDMVVMQPVIYHHHATKRILIASTQAFLDECLAGKTGLASNPEFKAAMQGLPSEGNGLSYASPDFVSTMRKVMFVAIDSSPAAEMKKPMTRLIDMMLPESNRAQASVTVNLPDGILIGANSALSYKDGVVTTGVGLLGGVGLLIPKSSVGSEEPPVIELVPPDAAPGAIDEDE